MHSFIILTNEKFYDIIKVELCKGGMIIVNLIIALAAFLAAWGVAIAIVAVAVLTASLIGVISAPIAAVILSVVAAFFATRAALRNQWVGVIFWLLTIGSGATAAAFGPGPLGVWGLVVGFLTAGILFAIPAAISLGGRSALRVLLVVQALVSLALIAREMGLILGGWPILAAFLLLGLAVLLGAGAYRPREVRRTQRLVSRLALLAAAALLLWQQVLAPSGRLIMTTGQEVCRALTSSPLGSWYRVISARAERVEIGETVKTAALRDLSGNLQRSHQERWRRSIGQIPSLPLSPREWEELGIPRQVDP